MTTIEAMPTLVPKSAAIWGNSESVTRTCAWLAKPATASSTIDSHIKRVRKKFLAVDAAFNMIDTLYGVGYRFKEA